MRQVNHNDLVIFMGDFNAKIGTDNVGWEHVMGRHGMGQRNENCELLIEICANHELRIGGSLLIHKEKHKVTWLQTHRKAPNTTNWITFV